MFYKKVAVSLNINIDIVWNVTVYYLMILAYKCTQNIFNAVYCAQKIVTKTKKVVIHSQNEGIHTGIKIHSENQRNSHTDKYQWVYLCALRRIIQVSLNGCEKHSMG